MKPPVLVTDGEQRASLALVRSLGRAGYPVHVVSGRRRSLAGASRFARSQSAVPDPDRSPDAFLSSLREAARERGIGVLIPVTDASLLAVLPERERFEGVRIPFPPADAFRRISDKGALMEHAAGIGIAVPRQATVSEPGAPAPDGLKFPVAVKSSRSISGLGEGRGKGGVSYVGGRTELESTLARTPTARFPMLVQERVRGPGAGIFLLRWEGRTLARFAHRRIREKPPSGGVSVYRESVRADPELTALSEKLLERFDWRGVAMVEYKREESSGTPYLMEVNGRFWGSLQLAIDAGVDFPALLLAAARGERPPPVTDYRVGVRSRWWWGDVDHLLLYLRRSPAELSLPPDASGRMRALGAFLKLWRPGDRSEVLRLGDPAPFLRETADWFRSSLAGGI